MGGIQEPVQERPEDRIVVALPAEGARGTVFDLVPALACRIAFAVAVAVADAVGGNPLKGFSGSGNSHSPCSYPWCESDQMPRGLRNSLVAGGEALVAVAY